MNSITYLYEITLRNKRYCEGCPFLQFDYEVSVSYCNCPNNDLVSSRCEIVKTNPRNMKRLPGCPLHFSKAKERKHEAK